MTKKFVITKIDCILNALHLPFETMQEQIFVFVFHFYFFYLGEECEFSSVSGTLRMLYHDQVYQYVINEHEYFSHVFQGK